MVQSTVCRSTIYYMVISLNYCSQNGGNVYRAPYYNGNPNIGPRIMGNLDQSPYTALYTHMVDAGIELVIVQTLHYRL